MEKNTSKSVKRELNFLEVRALNDLQYALFCVSAATRYLDASDDVVKSARQELETSVHDFMLAISYEHSKDN